MIRTPRPVRRSQRVRPPDVSCVPSALNATLYAIFVRPLMFVLTFPLTVLTLGLFLLVLNAAMLGLVALLVPGFHIAGFWTAVGASLVVSLVAWIASSLIGAKGRVEAIASRR